MTTMTGCLLCGVGPEDECSMDCPTRRGEVDTMTEEERLRQRVADLEAANDRQRRRLERTISMLREHVADWGECDADDAYVCICSHARAVKFVDALSRGEWPT